MKRIIPLICLFSLTGAFALEKSMLSLKLPSELEARQVQFFFQHRFYGKINEKPLDTFFGMDEGANAKVGFRIRPIKNFELVVSHVFRDNEYALGAGYAFPLPGLPIRGQVDAELFTNRQYYTVPDGVELKRKQFSAFRLDLVSKAILNRLTPVVNLGYDTELKRTGLGLGLDFAITPKYSLIGEYYPRLNKDGRDGLIYDSFAVGVKIQTYGHHFLFHIGNNTGIGTRKLMAGSAVNDKFFGFGIQRLLEF
jgi:hypothetical protein